MKKFVLCGVLAFGLAGCHLPRTNPHRPIITTTTTTTTPEVTCSALGCPGSPPDTDGCASGLPPVEGICP